LIYEIIVDDAATVDIQSAVEYYEEISPGLGFRLLDEFESLINHLSKRPKTYGYFDRYHRKAPLKKFPFLVFYEVLGNKVIIARFRHAKRDSKNLF
jgi:plasmid stabilization system protein ParE